MTTDSQPQTTATGSYADVNGLHLYYERHYNMAESPLVATTILDFLDAK